MNARVLVVDDDLTIAGVVGDYLQDAGLETRHAADGQSALSLAREWPPDIVVLDLMLPGSVPAAASGAGRPAAGAGHHAHRARRGG